MRGVDRHSRLVAWAKVVLPLAALGLLSSLFLLAERVDPDQAAGRASVDVDALVREPRMTAPDYSGITLDGTVLNVTAAVARPATPGRDAEAETARADLAMPGGGTAVITAPRLRLDREGGQLVLSGGVVLHSSTGYTVRTEGLFASLDRTRVTSAGAVSADGPAGRLDAGAFSLSLADDAPSPEADADREPAGAAQNGTPEHGAAPPGAAERARYLMLFSEGVRLIYTPATAARTSDVP